jgi:hypothetical protein
MVHDHDAFFTITKSYYFLTHNYIRDLVLVCFQSLNLLGYKLEDPFTTPNRTTNITLIRVDVQKDTRTSK